MFQNSIFHRYNSYLWVLLKENLIHPLVICSGGNLPLTKNVEKNKWWIHRKWIRKKPRIQSPLSATESFKQFWYILSEFFSEKPQGWKLSCFCGQFWLFKSFCSAWFKFPLLVFKCETSCFIPSGHGELLSVFL